MEYYPDSERDTISDKLDVVVKGLNACAALHYAKRFPMLEPDVYGYTLGRKYARVWYDMSNGQRVVAFFVQMDNGDVWKADGWKKPTLNFPRGCIWTAEGRAELFNQKIDTGYGGF